MLFFTIVKNFLITLGRIPLFIFRSILSLKLFIFALLTGLVWLGYSFFSYLPNPNAIYNPPKLSTKILDRNGVLLYKFYENEDRSWTPLSKIPTSLIEATLSIEDKDFYSHKGISVKGITTAIIYNLFKKGDEGKLRGGSTITQQLVKSVFFTNEKTWNRKVKEAILAIIIETKLSKSEILERYFNQVAYGGETYGVQEASKKYFNKNIEDISLLEATFLAGLPAAPSAYSPTGTNPELGYIRQKHVIEEMVNAKYLTREEADNLINSQVVIINTKTKILAPHFVFYIRDLIQKKYGYQNFERRGLVIKTSLDINTQKIAEQIVDQEISAIEKLRISNGGALVLNPKTGEILAMVGSKDYFSKSIEGKVNVTTSLRQPGSAIKPINYLLALMKGWSLASIIDDQRVVYQVGGQSKPYIPQNYNGKYMGKVTLRTALASSLNIPSVKLLAEDGTNNMIDLAEKMGISTWGERNRFGLALALGSGEVKMTELANAYSILANLGKKTDLNPVLEINNYLGENIYKNRIESEEVIEPKYAFLINSVLSDNNARAPIFGLNSKLNIDGKTVAVKTGTTNSLKDNWCIGWTPSVLVATWVGNNDVTPMSWVASGVSGATPIWNRIMKEMISNTKNEEWKIPEGVYKAEVCGKEEYFVDGRENQIECRPTNLIGPLTNRLPG